MTALIIISAILLLILLILLSSARLKVVYKDRAIVKVGVGAVMLRIYPPKEKKPRYLSAEEYKKLTAEKKSVPTASAAEKKEKGGGISSLIDTVKFVTELLRQHSGKIRGRINKLNITVASDNAAAAAIKYGIVCQSANYLYAYLENKTSLDAASRDNINISCDFTRENMTFDCDIVLKASIINILRIAFDIAKKKINADYKKGKK